MVPYKVCGDFSNHIKFYRNGIAVDISEGTADDHWIGLEDADKLADAENESYGMFLRVRGKYLIIARSKATDPKDDLIEGTPRIAIQIVNRLRKYES